MSVPKAKTLIERFGFNDPELTTPEHDEMFIVCMNSAQKIVGMVVESDKRFTTWRKMQQCLSSGELFCDSCGEQSHYTPWAAEDYYYISSSAIPEKPVVAGNGFMVGFIDMFVHAILGVCEIGGDVSPFKLYDAGYSTRRAMMDGVYGRDLEKIDNILINFNIMIEIKPSIRSAGELIRQMQTYRQYAKGDVVFVVISKTTGFKDILAQADIMLINYSDILPNQ